MQLQLLLAFFLPTLLVLCLMSVVSPSSQVILSFHSSSNVTTLLFTQSFHPSPTFQNLLDILHIQDNPLTHQMSFSTCSSEAFGLQDVLICWDLVNYYKLPDDNDKLKK